MTNKEGARIYKRVEIRIVAPPGEKGERIVFRAPGRNGYGEGAIQQMLDQAAETLERENPRLEFGLVEIEPNRFNFVFRGYRGSRASVGSSPI